MGRHPSRQEVVSPGPFMPAVEIRKPGQRGLALSHRLLTGGYGSSNCLALPAGIKEQNRVYAVVTGTLGG